MQYPHIQFYKGSLVRLASGKLKQVEDLSSDDFIESARLASGNSSSSSSSSSFDFSNTLNQQFNTFTATAPKSLLSSSSSNAHNQQYKINNNNISNERQLISNMQIVDNCFNSRQQSRSQSQPQNYRPTEDNSSSVFNSPEPTANTLSTRSSFNESPPMGMEIEEENCDNIRNVDEVDEDEDDDIDVELDVVTSEEEPPIGRVICNQNNGADNFHQQQAGATDEEDDFYIDSSVVRDFLEVGPIVQQQQQRKLKQASASNINQLHLTNFSSTTTSSTGSLTKGFPQMTQSNNGRAGYLDKNFMLFSSMPSTSKSSSSSSLAISPPIVTNAATVQQAQTVLIKFFLETSRSIAFIEVPIEHPFFVFHRGWSSWDPQKTYDKFGLKCRKLKIGDTCISLIRKRRTKSHSSSQQQESDQCNILFSSIRIQE